MNKIIRISVRDLVEFVMRSGDIDNRINSSVRAVDGIRAHQKLQGLYDESFDAEVLLKTEVSLEDVEFHIEGRADGVSITSERILVDEIKSTTRDLDDMDYDSQPLHWAQAKCYAHILCDEEVRDSAVVQLSYYNIETEDLKIIEREFTKDELDTFFLDLLHRYLEFSNRILKHREQLIEGIAKIEFPFDAYREGQRQLSVAVYNIIKHKRTLFAQAPTGIGKTVSTLFPAIKSIGEQISDKVFYLTSRNTQQQVAVDTINLIDERENCIKHIRLIAKEKLCDYELKCNPNSCPLAKGHYDRVNDCILDLFDNENYISEEVLREYAAEHNVCPFELQLDMASYSDIIVCDYNYAFDPHVQLRRFFENPMEKYTLLVDEAHNLVDRGREMYSAQLSLSDFEELREAFGKKVEFKKLKKVNDAMINAFDTFNLTVRYHTGKSENYSNREHTDLFYTPGMKFAKVVEDYFAASKSEPDEIDELLLNAYFSIYRFLKIDEVYDSSYVTIGYRGGSVIELKCMDTSTVFRSMLSNLNSCIFFSATLNPIEYYKYLLGDEEDSQYIRLKSPFDKENLQVIRYPVSTKYRDRERTKGSIVQAMRELVDRKGNYMVFFPSYDYMEMVYDQMDDVDRIIVQGRNMTQSERQDYLDSFQVDSNVIGFVVMGGIFSEGIDLKGDRLNGVVLVSVGLPKFSFEREVIKDYFTEKFDMGYEYAYLYPSSNKIAQSGGRLIRTAYDRGVILLLDDRFLKDEYVVNLPSQWGPIETIKNLSGLQSKLKDFYKDEETID